MVCTWILVCCDVRYAEQIFYIHCQQEALDCLVFRLSLRSRGQDSLISHVALFPNESAVTVWCGVLCGAKTSSTYSSSKAEEEEVALRIDW